MMSRVVGREGADWSSPSQAIYGPKVMIINQMSGSGGDALPWYFRKAGIGPLIGKRTWGGLVGIGGYPDLIDGGYGDRAARGHLRPQRRVGSRESRRAAGHRSGSRSAGIPRRARCAARQGDRGGDAEAEGKSAADVSAAGVSQLSPERRSRARSPEQSSPQALFPPWRETAPRGARRSPARALRLRGHRGRSAPAGRNELIGAEWSRDFILAGEFIASARVRAGSCVSSVRRCTTRFCTKEDAGSVHSRWRTRANSASSAGASREVERERVAVSDLGEAPVAIWSFAQVMR